MPADTTLVGNLVVQETVIYEGEITPSEITGDQDNYAPTGFDAAITLRLSSNATRSLTGLAGGAAGREVRVWNVGSFNVVLQPEDAGSTAGNRFAIPAFITLAPNQAVILQYDGTSARWRALRASSSGGGGAAVWGDIGGDINDQIDLITAIAAVALPSGGSIGNILAKDGANDPAWIDGQQLPYDPAAPANWGGSPPDSLGGALDFLAQVNPQRVNPATVQDDLGTHLNDFANPHAVTKAQVGLGSADDTSDAGKPVSTAQQAALNLKANLASPTFTGTPAAPTATPGDNTTKIATTAFVSAAVALVPKVIQVAASDLTTDITAATNKAIFRMPYAMTLTEVRASLATAPTGSTFIADINKNGTTVLSTKLSVDASEKTSVTAAVPPVISVSALADDDEIEIDFDQVGSSVPGKGVIITLIGH